MKAHTYTAQYLGKWHAGFTIGNQSFTLACNEGTEEEAQWFASMLDKAFANLRAKDGELIQMAVGLASKAPDGDPEVIRIACEMFLAAAAKHGFKPTEP